MFSLGVWDTDIYHLELAIQDEPTKKEWALDVRIIRIDSLNAKEKSENTILRLRMEHFGL